MNITIQGVEITPTPEQLQQIDAEVKKMNEPKKPTKEERFWELMSGLAIKVDWDKYPNSIFLFKEDKCWVEYDIKNKYLWLRYDAIWSVFYNEYSMNYDQVQSFIEDTVEKHFNCKGVTPFDNPEIATESDRDEFEKAYNQVQFQLSKTNCEQ